MTWQFELCHPCTHVTIATLDGISKYRVMSSFKLQCHVHDWSVDKHYMYCSEATTQNSLQNHCDIVRNDSFFANGDNTSMYDDPFLSSILGGGGVVHLRGYENNNYCNASLYICGFPAFIFIRWPSLEWVLSCCYHSNRLIDGHKFTLIYWPTAIIKDMAINFEFN